MAGHTSNGSLRTPEIHPNQLRTLRLLLEHADVAERLNRPRWEFALDIRHFTAAGVTVRDLGELICQQAIEHRLEVSGPRSRRRRFQEMPTQRTAIQGTPHRRTPSVAFADRSCFILTPAGESLARRLAARSEDESRGANPAAGPRPRWNRHRRELSLEGRVVLQIRRSAPRLEPILEEFEACAWAPRIACTLPAEVTRRKRVLDYTLGNLNRKCLLEKQHVSFHADGIGGITWKTEQARARHKRRRKKNAQ